MFTVGSILEVLMRKRVIQPILKIQEATEKMAGGSLSVEIDVQSNDELGQLVDNVKRTSDLMSLYIQDISQIFGAVAKGNMSVTIDREYIGDFIPIKTAIVQITEYLNRVLSQIVEAAKQISSGSGQVAGGSQALSQGATEQASSIEELAASINGISEQVRQNAMSAQEAKDSVGEVGGKLLTSNRQMQEMTKAMDEVRSSSGEIGKIIKTIEDISFQTNILALNAAVEAARAGAAGKGFAVVADEVRNLANKSAEASKNTSALIEGSLNAVESGTRIAEETAASLLTVVEGTKAITALINRIADASASARQADTIVQVSQGVDQISSVVQTNSATEEQSAAASEELSGEAQMLKVLVSGFTLKDQAADLPLLEPASEIGGASESSGKY